MRLVSEDASRRVSECVVDRLVSMKTRYLYTSLISWCCKAVGLRSSPTELGHQSRKWWYFFARLAGGQANQAYSTSLTEIYLPISVEQHNKFLFQHPSTRRRT